jgi:ABC-type enterochelin transport system substrate-binding protein
MNADERIRNKNHSKPIGLKVVTKRNPHAIYVALRVYSLHR